jgi:hypothetical protein
VEYILQFLVLIVNKRELPKIKYGMQHFHLSSPQAPIHNNPNRLICLLCLLYVSDNLLYTPLKYKSVPIVPICLIKKFIGAAACYGLLITNLLATNYVQVCTTKYIFWLGKNKFDRTTAILVSAGR